MNDHLMKLLKYLTAVFLKLVQCQPQLNHKIQPFVVEGFISIILNPFLRVFGVPEIGGFGGMDDMAKPLRNGLSMIATNPLNRNWLDSAI